MFKKLVSDYERFRRKIRIDAENGCWIWEGTLDRDGYAKQAKLGSRTDGTRRQMKPHRWMYEYFRGPIPVGLVTDHLCRNKACVNPAHLEVVTPEENSHRWWAARTECANGHSLLGDNVVIRSNRRMCRICRNAYARQYQGAARARKREEQNRHR